MEPTLDVLVSNLAAAKRARRAASTALKVAQDNRCDAERKHEEADLALDQYVKRLAFVAEQQG